MEIEKDGIEFKTFDEVLDLPGGTVIEDTGPCNNIWITRRGGKHPVCLEDGATLSRDYDHGRRVWRVHPHAKLVL